MAKRSIQGFVELASGLGELTRSRAQEAATELLTLTGVEGSSKKVAKQAGRLAEDLLVAAEANRKQVVRLVRSEVESALGRVDVGRLVSEVQGLGATVAALAAQVDDLARSAAGRPSSTPVAKVVAVEPEPARVAARPSAPAATTPAKKAPAKKASAKKAPVKKAPAKKSTAKKSTAKKSTVKTTAAASTATASAKKAPAKKAPAKKSTAKKSTAQKSTAKKAPAAQSSASNGGSST